MATSILGIGMGPGGGLFQVGQRQVPVAEPDVVRARPRNASGSSGSRRRARDHSRTAALVSLERHQAEALRSVNPVHSQPGDRPIVIREGAADRRRREQGPVQFDQSGLVRAG